MTTIYTDQKYDCTWTAYDENYDGAPDAGPQIVGYGNTEEEALREYRLKLMEFEGCYIPKPQRFRLIGICKKTRSN